MMETLLVLKRFKIAFLLATLSCLPEFVSNDFIKNDITNERAYGCRWYGGSSPVLSCYCEDGAEMHIQRYSIPVYETTEIHIINCHTVTITENAIDDIKSLRDIHFTDIKSLHIASGGINWYSYRSRGNVMWQEERYDFSVPSLHVTITNCHVTAISSHAFAGRISEIIIQNSSIAKIEPMAFANLLQSDRVAIRHTRIDTIDMQAFKKFATENLELNNLTTNQIPSRAFSSVTVYKNFTISNCSFDTIRPSGFMIENPKLFQVLYTNVSHLNGEAFKISSRGTVIFRNNTFGEVHDRAFDGIKLNRNEYHVSDGAIFIFDSNTFYSLSRYSLAVSDFDVKYHNIYINETCDCTSLDHKIKESEFYGDIKCLYDVDGTYRTVKEYKANMCSVITTYYVSLTIACVVIVLVAIVLSALGLYFRYFFRRKKYGNNAANNSKSGKGALSLIVPDGRTYRETELHVIVERTDLLTTDL